MKILIFANYNPFILSLISRLDKEGHTVFVVTGNDKKTSMKPRNVFQEYNFPFNSESIKFIIGNIEADIAIFESAIDSLVDLENQQKKILDYMSGITNIMLSLKESTIKKLIYVSNLRVFSGNKEIIIDEQTTPKPVNNSDNTIFMGEKVCKNFERDRKFKVSIVRFSKLYGEYNNDYLKNNKITEICEKIIKDEPVKIVSQKKHNMIYIDDAVDGLYKVLENDDSNLEIYHIAPSESDACTERDIVEVLTSKISNKNIEVIEDNENIKNVIYNTDKIKKLNFNIKYKIDEKVLELYNTIKKSKNNRDESNNQKISIITRIFKIDNEIKNRVFPFLENLGFFIILNIVIYFTRSMPFHTVIDVYLLYIVTIALIYGFEQTIFAIVLSVISKLFFTFTLGGSAGVEPGYYMFMWILEIFTIGISVGYLKEQYKLKYLDMKDENEYLNNQLINIKDINKNNEEIKELYERRLVNYKDSFGRIYEIVSELDVIQPSGVIFKAISVMRKIMNTKDVSIYIYGGNSEIFRLMAYSSKKAKTLKNSLKVSESPEMFDKLLNNEIYINGTLDPNYPVMAGGTYKNESLQSIVMIWSLPFESNNLYQTNVFGVSCKLIERSLNIGSEYIESISKNANNKNDNIIDRDSFKDIVGLYVEGAKDNIVEYSLLQVKRETESNPEDFNNCLKSCIRETDFIGQGEGLKMNILLINASKIESMYVVDRLKSKGIEVVEGEMLED